MLLRLFLLLALSLSSVPLLAREAPFAPPAGDARTVYRGFTLIDGSGGPVRRDMALITRGERIEAVLPAAGLDAARIAGAPVVDLAGRFLLPGLIDSHQHLATPPDRATAEAAMRRDLYSGVTTLRIMADDLRSIAELDRAARTGEIAGPDLVYAAVFAGPGFFADPRTQAVSAGWTPGEAPWAQAIDASTDLTLAVARARGTGASAVKIYADLPPDLVRRLADEAHRQGLKVWAHGMVFPTPPSDVIAAGPDSVSHTCYLAYQLSDPRPATYADRFPVDYEAFAQGDRPEMTAMFRDMRERGMVLDATLRVYRETDRRAAAAPGGRPYHCNLDLAARLTDQARREGVLISAGTDGVAPRADAFPELYDELELLVSRAGMTPAEAIRSATAIGAVALGRPDELGTIAPGRLADFVVTADDPLADVRNLRSLQFTVKRGRRFERSDYRPITPQEMPDDE